uniref:Uncharacterized protein n=1 Tax=viral metagenome TaxID=1070528 RepID=A0A6C0ADS2_9ZZZZ
MSHSYKYIIYRHYNYVKILNIIMNHNQHIGIVIEKFN